jgi:hypothetical protein
MGGKAGPSNNQMVGFEMQQAQEAKDKENLRQARLDQGKSAIDTLFSNANFGDNFYNTYNKAELDSSLPQLEDQYTTAKTGLGNDLARAGLLRSGAAGYTQGLLNKQHDVNEASLRAKADSDTGQLRSSIQSQQQQAYNQLFATEDPSVAANTAANSVANAQYTQPNIEPLGALFKPIVVGASAVGAPIYGQYQANQYMNPQSPFGSGSLNTQSQT